MRKSPTLGGGGVSKNAWGLRDVTFLVISILGGYAILRITGVTFSRWVDTVNLDGVYNLRCAPARNFANFCFGEIVIVKTEFVF